MLDAIGRVLTYQDLSNPNSATAHGVVWLFSTPWWAPAVLAAVLVVVLILYLFRAESDTTPVGWEKERQTYLMTISHLITNSPNQKVAEPAESETKKPAIPAIADGYLRDQETPLSSALYLMAHHGAWGKWYSAQQLASTNSLNDWVLMTTATSLVVEAAMNGKIHIRGRNPGEIEYEDIPRDTWRLAYLQVREDKSTIWRVYPIPRTDVKPEQIQKLLAYDSLLVDSQEFQIEWPPKHELADALRRVLLEQAKKNGADSKLIERLS